jgi:type IV pilus assembly protein PilE
MTLLELMVAVAIVAILAAVALPVYSGYSARAHRANAQADLLRCAQGMERHAVAQGDYRQAVDTDGDGAGDASAGAVSENICAVEAQHYAITVHSASAAGYALRATPAANTPVAEDGMLELDSLGTRRWDRDNDGQFAAAERSWSE